MLKTKEETENEDKRKTIWKERWGRRTIKKYSKNTEMKFVVNYDK